MHVTRCCSTISSCHLQKALQRIAPMLVCPLGAVDVVEKGQYITLRNAKIDMYKGSMRLAVNQWGKVEPAEKQNFDAKVGAPIAPM